MWNYDGFRDNISNARKLYWSNPENRERIRQTQLELQTEEHKALISERVKEAYKNPEMRAKFDLSVEASKKPVVSSDGQVFESIRDAADALGIYSSSIVRVLKGKYKKAGGLGWKYKD